MRSSHGQSGILKMAMFLFVAIFVLPLAGMADVPQTAEEHRQLAEAYHKKAEAEREIVREHEKMKVEYREHSAGNPKFGETRWVKKIDRHCNALIDKARILAEEFQKFADWHGMRAAELEGK